MITDICPLIDEISVHSSHLDAEGMFQSKLADIFLDDLDVVCLLQRIEQLPKMHGFIIDEQVGNDLSLNVRVRDFIGAVNKNIRRR